jgi:signal transduction histidine kinase
MAVTRSLTTRLSLQVGVAQASAFLITMLAMCMTLLDGDARTVSKGLANQVAQAVVVDGQRLVIDTRVLPAAFLQASGSAWLIAVDDAGRTITAGPVPVAAQPLTAVMRHFEPADFSTRDDSGLASRLVVLERSTGRLHVLVGGVSRTGLLNQSGMVFKYIGSWIVIPVIITTALVLPWVIHSGLKGITRIAEQASSISLHKRDRLLDAGQVPGEIRPLVEAFNEALLRIWRASETRDRFLANAAHELRMPIAVLSARLAHLPPSEVRPKLQADLARLANIAEQLLDLERLDRRLAELEQLDLRALCRGVAEDVAPLIVGAGYEFALQLPDHAVHIQGDSGSLQRMLTSLLQNAISHGGDAGLIEMELDEQGLVQVSDQGSGVPEDEQENIFAPFYRLHSIGGGSGLGLHLAQEVAVRHGGRIRVKRAQAGGACFSVKLPRAGLDA